MKFCCYQIHLWFFGKKYKLFWLILVCINYIFCKYFFLYKKKGVLVLSLFLTLFLSFTVPYKKSKLQNELTIRLPKNTLITFRCKTLWFCNVLGGALYITWVQKWLLKLHFWKKKRDHTFRKKLISRPCDFLLSLAQT